MVESQPGSQQEKPAERHSRIGIINRSRINMFLFILVGVSILIAMLIIILAIWDYIWKGSRIQVCSDNRNVNRCGRVF